MRHLTPRAARATGGFPGNALRGRGRFLTVLGMALPIPEGVRDPAQLRDHYAQSDAAVLPRQRVTPSDPGPGRGRRLRGALRDLAPAVAAYAAVRALGLLGLAWTAAGHGTTLWARLHSWDALWLTRVAEGGYDTGVRIAATGRPELTDIVFFPLMPVTMRAVSAVTGLSPYVAGLVVSALAGAAAAVALQRLGRLLLGSRTAGLALVVLWAAWPHGIVLSMTYTEALFTALAAWSLLHAVTGRWVLAGSLALLAGATRPSGFALVGALAVLAAFAVVGAVRSGRWREAAGPLVALALAPLGWLAFLAWVGHALGRPDGWFWMERVAWLTWLDGGAYEAGRIRAALTSPGPVVFTVSALIVLACVLLFVALLRDTLRFRLPGDATVRAWWALATYAGLVLAVAIATAGYQHSKPRHLLVAFPLLLPVAARLARAPRAVRVVVLLAASAASAWYGGYLLVVWTGSP